ncbi:MAG: phosphoribosylglycinamide formyltransferase [candidate division WOR-3 bacterium]|nr:phosphoribosylglycinamide formyltransferase [candidate division WOR-3 bacterium]MCX7837109.1 phosphoribosylglycinamide formyltransferase [candidate division WOR-3 bacterium]MDW8113983.1 phosphoribosylglycinamide formyltransferase [candidate division WOR-3 bacterium]
MKIAVLVSGRGTNLQAIIDACENNFIPGKVVCVISNIENVYALERAKKHNIPNFVISHKNKERIEFEKELIKKLEEFKPDLICLAGFMRILTPYFIEYYRNRIMNIHPALLPAFKGLYGEKVHKAVIESGAKFSGCTVHFVTEEVDGGPIILQRIVPVEDEDTPETLAERVLKEEHIAYPMAIRLFAEGRLKIEGKRVKILY